MRTRAHFISFIFLFVFMYTALVSSACAVIRIMPLGDSITAGYDDSIPDTEWVGYREKLYLDLIDEGYDVDFVGQEQNGQFIDPWHEGHNGWHADYIEDNVYNWLVQNPADIVLLHIGTNDISNGQSAEGVRTEIEGILDEIDDYELNSGIGIMVFLARIINRQDPFTTEGLETTTLNGLLQTLVDDRSNAGYKILAVDQENALNYPDYMADEWHPNMTGYNKMADVWFSVLPDLLPVADFYADPVNGVYPLTVNFTDQSTGNITSWEWDLGDGSPFSYEQNPQHTYEDPGRYTVSLTVSGPYGSDTEVKTDYITVPMVEPIPNIKANGSDGPLELTSGETLSVTIELDPGIYAGYPADWWVVAQTPMGWYYKTVGGPWQPGLEVTHQGPLFNLSTREILHTSSLPSGLYTFRFGVDMDMNGKINMDQMYYDIVEVNITP